MKNREGGSRSMKWYVWLFAVLAVLVTACGNHTDQASLCANLVLFQGQISETFTPQEFLEWIAKTQGVAVSEVEILDLPSTLPIGFIWTTGNYRYSATLEDDKFTEIRIGTVDRGGIPARIVTECLGKPEIYRAIHDADIHVLGGELTFEMVFSSSVMAQGFRFYRRVPATPLSIDENFTIRGFVITSPGTAVEILQKVYITSAQDTFKWMHPWPENWEDIQVDVTPAMQRRLSRSKFRKGMT
ncbi:MAG: hypothetical protein ACP5J4_18650 [Anaerolineae bacterium]